MHQICQINTTATNDYTVFELVRIINMGTPHTIFGGGNVHRVQTMCSFYSMIATHHAKKI